MTSVRVPVATYRIQFHRDFRFVDARDIVPYLHELGVSEIYASPRFRARRGSSHGYDVANPLRVNSELGTDEDFNDLCEKLQHYGMGLVLDIVPNHMAASHENPWWMDVLEHGPSSPFARYFDIDWHPATSKAAFLQENRVLVPMLGDLYGNVLENRELSLRLDEGGLYVRYWDHRFPLDPKSYAPVLEYCADRLAVTLGSTHPAVAEMRRLIQTVEEMPPRTVTEPGLIRERRERAVAVKQRLFRPYRDALEIRLAFDTALRDFSGTKGDQVGFGRLHAVLEDQAYRLAYWKIAFEEINYRRFFDINELVSLRMDEEDVFEARHQIILQLVKDGRISGLRVDHIDGLYDPATYLARLRDALEAATPWRKLYLVVEKILGRNEPLPPDWQADGTTGYDFLNVLNDLFIDPEGLRRLEASYAGFTAETRPFAEICYARNKQVMWSLFTGEVNALGHHLGRLAAQDRQARDVPLSELMHALVEVTACLPVYRTYVRGPEIAEHDRLYLERTIALARQRTSGADAGPQAFDFLRRVFLLEPQPYAVGQKEECLRFVMRWQQFTGPVMAKGLEDTAFYVYNSLISRNEVGGDPLRDQPPLDLDGFHRFNQRRLEHWPHSMSATSTHDTKRSEDVRARINVLTELAAEWDQRLARWSEWNRAHKTAVDGAWAPAPGEEVLLYQSLLGVWPLDPDEMEGFSERFRGFVIKAVREAKTWSSWIAPDQPHEAALLRFVDGILGGSGDGPFLPDFLEFQERVAWHGALNSLSQTLIKITAPGVPDTYQGTEMWDFSLVDPDNRRPVDFRKRIAALEEIHRCASDPTGLLADLVGCWKDGRIKLFLTDKVLDFRRERASLYLDGDYVPLAVEGPRQSNACAFARAGDGAWALTAAPRWTTQLAPAGQAPLGEEVWTDTRLVLPAAAPTNWRHALSGEILTAPERDGHRTLYLRDALRRFPVALLAGV